MKFKITIKNTSQEDFNKTVESLKKKEHAKLIEDSNKIKTGLLNSKLPKSLVFMVLRSPAFTTVTQRRIQEWKVLETLYYGEKANGEGVIVYTYDTQPVNLETIATMFEMGRFVRQSVVKDFWQIQEEAHRQMWEAAMKKEGKSLEDLKMEVI